MICAWRNSLQPTRHVVDDVTARPQHRAHQAQWTEANKRKVNTNSPATPLLGQAPASMPMRRASTTRLALWFYVTAQTIVQVAGGNHLARRAHRSTCRSHSDMRAQAECRAFPDANVHVQALLDSGASITRIVLSADDPNRPALRWHSCCAAGACPTQRPTADSAASSSAARRRARTSSGSVPRCRRS
jgi:hypothetical protein